MIRQAARQAVSNLRFRLSAANHPLFIGFYRYLYKPKPGSLSEFLDAYSRSKKGDFYVIQVGANDGINHDPIHKFIKRDDWSGILLEPQPYVYETFLRPIYAKNKGLHPLCAAIGEEDGTRTLYQIGFSTMRWATGLASFDRKRIEQAFEEGFVQSRCEKYGVPLPDSPDEWITTEEVAVISPRTLLAQYDLPRIDLLQIDTEGFDYQVIRMFDIGQTQPQAIIFEHMHLSSDEAAACHALLTDNGYQTKPFGGNTLALKEQLAANRDQ